MLEKRAPYVTFQKQKIIVKYLMRANLLNDSKQSSSRLSIMAHSWTPLLHTYGMHWDRSGGLGGGLSFSSSCSFVWFGLLFWQAVLGFWSENTTSSFVKRQTLSVDRIRTLYNHIPLKASAEKRLFWDSLTLIENDSYNKTQLNGYYVLAVWRPLKDLFRF